MEVLILYAVMMFDTRIETLSKTQYLLIVSVVLSVFTRITLFLHDEDLPENWKKVMKCVIILLISVTFVKAIIPTTKQGMVLVASGAVIESAKTETAQRIAG